MLKILDKVFSLYPDKIVLNLSQHSDIYYLLSKESSKRNISIKELLTQNGFLYGEDSTIVKLENEIHEELENINLEENCSLSIDYPKLYSKISRVSKFYEVSITNYLSQLGINYTIKQGTESKNSDYIKIKRLHQEFHIKQTDIAKFNGATREWIRLVLEKDNSELSYDWSSIALEDYEIAIFKEIIKNHIFHFTQGNNQFWVINNMEGSVCIICFDTVQTKCFFDEKIPLNLLSEIKKHKMDFYCQEDFTVLESVPVIYILKKPVLFVTKEYAKNYGKAAKKHNYDLKKYANFLGYSGYAAKPDTIKDSDIVNFFEDNLIDNKVYISSNPHNQWIRSFASRNAEMNLEELIEFYGYEKMPREYGKQTIEYHKIFDEKYKTELNKCIIKNPNIIYLDSSSSLYRNIYSLSKRRGYNKVDDYLLYLGYIRSHHSAYDDINFMSDIGTNIKINELRDEINNILKYQQPEKEYEEKTSEIRKRNRIIVDKLKSIYGYRCQLCTKKELVNIELSSGKFYTEVHHIKNLASEINEEENLDIIENLIVLCPNHHKILHYHHGGFNKIIKDEDKFYFINDKEEKIEIIVNYHLTSNT